MGVSKRVNQSVPGKYIFKEKSGTLPVEHGQQLHCPYNLLALLIIQALAGASFPGVQLLVPIQVACLGFVLNK